MPRKSVASWVAGLEMSFHLVPQNWKQHIQNDLYSVDRDVKPQNKHTNRLYLYIICLSKNEGRVDERVDERTSVSLISQRSNTDLIKGITEIQ